MVTSKIAQLSETDLDYLDQLLHKEFNGCCSQSKKTLDNAQMVAYY